MSAERPPAPSWPAGPVPNGSSVSRLHPDDLAALASLVADEVCSRLGTPQAARPLVTVEKLAEHLGVKTSYVYDHADELGAIRLGDGPRARLRFDVEESARRLARVRSGVDPDTGQRRVRTRYRRTRRPRQAGPDPQPVPQPDDREAA